MIDKKLYDELKRLKKNGSFSDAIRKLLKERRRYPGSTAGILQDEDDRLDYQEIIQARREKDVSL